jgi:hypothetical protein
MAAPAGWDPLVADLEPHVTPEWSRYAREHGEQGWIRLVLMVDAHHQLSSPRIAEKVAMTMADLAGDRESEREGWEAIRASAGEARVQLVTRLTDTAEEVLSEELVALFARSIEPRGPMG